MEAVLCRASADLETAGVRFALIGGLAVSARVEPRFTRDLDFAVAVEGDADAEALVGFLRNLGYEVIATVEQDAVGRLATARLIPPGEDAAGIVVDLLFASTGIEAETVAGAEPMEIFEGLTVRVARTPHLIAMKVLASDPVRRPQDMQDLGALIRAALPVDLESASKLLRRIGERGFARGKDLVADLAALLGRFRSPPS